MIKLHISSSPQAPCISRLSLSVLQRCCSEQPFRKGKVSGVNAALSGPIHANCHMQDAHKRAAKINEAPCLSRDVCSYLAAGFRPNTYRSCSASPQHGQVHVQSRASSLKKQLNHRGKQAQLTSISLNFLFDFLIIKTATPHSIRTGDVNIK